MFKVSTHVLEIKASEEADVTRKRSIRIMVLAGKIMTEEVKEMNGKVVDKSYQAQPVFQKLICVRIQLSFRTRNLNMNKFAMEDVHPFPHLTATIPICEKMELVKNLSN